MNDRSSASSSSLDGEGERLGLCSEGLRRPRWRPRPRATGAGGGEGDRLWRSGEGVHAGSLKRAHVVFVNIPNTDFLVSFIT